MVRIIVKSAIKDDKKITITLPTTPINVPIAAISFISPPPRTSFFTAALTAAPIIRKIRNHAPPPIKAGKMPTSVPGIKAKIKPIMVRV